MFFLFFYDILSFLLLLCKKLLHIWIARILLFLLLIFGKFIYLYLYQVPPTGGINIRES